MVFILFLIPAMPKDVFTYLVPLTNMRMRTFLILATIGRIPGVLVSTYAAAGLAEGQVTTSLIIFGVAAAIALVCLFFVIASCGCWAQRKHFVNAIKSEKIRASARMKEQLNGRRGKCVLPYGNMNNKKQRAYMEIVALRKHNGTSF